MVAQTVPNEARSDRYDPLPWPTGEPDVGPVPVAGPLSMRIPYEQRVAVFPLAALFRSESRWLRLFQVCDRAGDAEGRAVVERRLDAVLAELDRRGASAKAEEDRRVAALAQRYPARPAVSLLGLTVPSGVSLARVRGGRRHGR